MEYTFRKKEYVSGGQNENRTALKMAGNIPNSALESVMAGKAKASPEMMGHRQDLAPSLAVKMSRAFGMDLSGVKLYRSDAMEESGTKGLASGNRIVLSSDVDLNTMSGQAVLGHELSHVHAQSLGTGLGHSGLYQNAALEQKADTEGMMAARGLSFQGEALGMDTAGGMQGFDTVMPLGSGLSSGAGAPLQAKKQKNAKKQEGEKQEGEKQEGEKSKQFASDIRKEPGRGWKNKGLQTKWYNLLGIYNTAATRKAYQKHRSEGTEPKNNNIQPGGMSPSWQNQLYKESNSGLFTLKEMGKGMAGKVKYGINKIKGYGLTPEWYSKRQQRKGENALYNEEEKDYDRPYDGPEDDKWDD